MRKLLPTQYVSKDVLRRLMNLSLLIFTFIILSFDTSYGQSFGQTECDCLQNGNTDQNGQFGESIFVSSNAGETWTVVSADGFYDATSPNPPADPVEIMPGTMLTANGGTYTLNGVREPNTMWTVVLTDGTNEYTRSSIHVCSNPPSDIVGDFGACVESTELYNGPVVGSSNIQWTVDGGTVIGSMTSPQIEIMWETVGEYTLSYTADSPSSGSATTGTCAVSASEMISITDEDAFPLACNNNVNISLNGQCELMLTADMLLEDMRYNSSSYDLVLTDMSNDTIVPGPMIGMEYINTVLMVAVVHDCSGNSCWGTVTLEDKTVPPLTCPDDITLDCDMLMTPEATGFPVPASATVTQIDNDEYLVEGFDLCSDVILQYSDNVISTNLCDGPYSSVVERRWLATDISGNESTCSFLINVNRATLDDLTFPESYDDALGPNPSLEACGNYPKLDDGNPHPDHTGYPDGTFCLNVVVDFEDRVLPKCGDQAFKILRKWTVDDLCSYERREQTQTITIMDNTDPEIEAPANYTVGTGEADCNSIIDVIPPSIEDCSETMYSISYKAVVAGEDPYFQPSNDNIVEDNEGNYTITQLPSHEGQVYILYYVEDKCGNISRDYTIVTIEDNQQPIPVCDLHTFIALGESAIGYAGIDAFDDGSWDNCGIDKIEIRRMVSSSCESNNNWRDKIKFCCSDVGNVVMVQLRVTDNAGNTNVCMVEAEVQDNHDPEFTFCPADVTVDCDADITNLDQYGTATAIDNCNVSVASTSTGSVNECGEGTITRTFTATDNFGNSAVCRQRIYVRNLDPFYINPYNPNDSSDDIVWPGSVNISNGCAGDDIDPDNLPSGKQRPSILREGCSNVSMSHKDVVFQYVDDACLKVLRTWTVLDHCRFTTPLSSEGIWTYTQTIKIENSTAPEFISGCSASDVAVTQVANCRARLEVSASATDDCTADIGIKYSYEIDYDNNGSVNSQGDGRIINELVDFGTHRIIWSAEDECGNVETCDFTITVEDDKKPTPYCKSEIVTVIMAETGEVSIWASDFDNGSFDNCTDPSQLRISFSPNVNDRLFRIRCEDLTQSPQEFEVNMYVTDLFGNSDFCTTTLIIQDNQDVCGVAGNDDDDDDDDANNRIALAGHIYNDQNQMLESVDMQLNASLPEFPKSSITDGEGEYLFEDLLESQSYVVKPMSSGIHREGINTLDLVKIQRHLLGLEVMDSPYRIIAADVTNDEKVSPADLLAMRKLILGLYDEFPNNESWRFVDAAYTFDDASSPFPFEEDVFMLEMEEDYTTADFVAIKVGDVDGSASNLTSDDDIETRSTTSISTQEQLLAVGYNEIEFSADGLDNFYGLQMVLALNQKLVSDITISSDLIAVSEENFRYVDGKLYVSVHEGIAADINENLFTLKVTTRDEAYVSDILSLESSFMEPQIVTETEYGVSGVPFNIDISNRSSDIEHEFELYQNVPNPFSSTTDISFVLPTEQSVTLTVMDITGKVVYRTSGRYSKGYNVMTLDVSNIAASGIMHYQLDTETNSDSRKMIILK